MDLGPRIAFPALAEGTPVYDPGGRRVGVVDEVLIEPPGGIFEGVVVHTLPLPGRHLHAPPDQIAEIHRGGVLLSVGADELPEEVGWRHRDRDRTPSPEPPLQRFARRVLDRLGGRS
ncbi:PRC-barrel domain-containing protein [Baekduia sp. Peel2402]|uniref:PRC-barrel domain-containing protein n=1 Tax=Baekduia sp. Peel2402 TaxID=3458296 RepID=UPI00403EE8F7